MMHMKLAHPQLDSVFDFDRRKVNTLVIEAPTFFRELLRDIHAQIDGYAGAAVLSQHDEPIDFRGNAELIDSFLSFEISRKSLVSKLISRMEAEAVNESNYMRTAQLMGELEAFIHELCFQLPCDAVCGKLNIGSMLRAAGIAIPDDYSNDLERLLDYMDLTRELEREKLFIFVNLRSYYSDEEISRFLSSVLDHECHVFMVDGIDRPILPLEARVTIDGDLCEF